MPAPAWLSVQLSLSAGREQVAHNPRSQFQSQGQRRHFLLGGVGEAPWNLLPAGAGCTQVWGDVPCA